MATVDNRLPTEGTQIDIEARLHAIETALASLMADTTGQSIATAISGLGSTLGSDKANIDGSNIANPSAFRSAILNNTTYVNDFDIVSNRVSIESGGCLIYGQICFLNIAINGLVNLTNVPSILTLPSNKTPISAFVLSANDITNGVNNIGESIPCAIGSNRNVYIRKIETGKKYLISGYFILS